MFEPTSPSPAVIPETNEEQPTNLEPYYPGTPSVQAETLIVAPILKGPPSCISLHVNCFLRKNLDILDFRDLLEILDSSNFGQISHVPGKIVRNCASKAYLSIGSSRVGCAYKS